jgi:prepilin-type N-terminal cleavage/methylation domain-containing protein
MKKERGFGLIEIIIASAIISVAISSLAATSGLALRVVSKSALKEKAHFLLEEGVEATRIQRDLSWHSNIAQLATSTAHYATFNAASGAWEFGVTDPGLIDGVFSRTITFDAVYRRDSDDDIVDVSSSDPKTIDYGTRETNVSVAWGSGEQVALTTYITNMFSN